MIRQDSLSASTLTKYISYKQLYLGESKKDVIYIGYPLAVTKTEYEILKVLTESAGTAVSADRIALYLGDNITEKNVVYHVFNINKKAKAIGNREIIKNISKIGYFLNEEM